jgi:hypothetical protein
MAVSPDAEGVRNAIKAQLEGTGYQAQLEAVYAEKGVPEEVEHLLAVYRSVKWAPAIFPCAEIGLVRGSAEAQEHYLSDVSYTVYVYFHVNGTDEEEIEDKVGRFIRAAIDFWRDRPNMLPELASATVTVGDDDYSPISRVATDSAPLIKTGALTLTVRVLR